MQQGRGKRNQLYPVLTNPRTLTFATLLLLPALKTNAQSANPNQTAEPDVIICKDGEKFLGQLISSTDASDVFKSDSAGQFTIDWGKIQELHSTNKFAVIPKGMKLDGRVDVSKPPQGTLSATNQQIQVSSAQAAPQTLPVTNVARVVDQAAFRRAFQPRSFFQGWAGGATAGIAYTNSTQKSQSYTAAVNLTRSVPTETWLDIRSRTLLNLNEAYGEISEPGVPTTKTSILHAGLEQDWYFTQRLFGFVQTLFD